MGQAKWATQIKARDGGCVECGATEGLHAHHIDGDPTNNILENGETLCLAHHRAQHPDLPEVLFASTL